MRALLFISLLAAVACDPGAGNGAGGGSAGGTGGSGGGAGAGAGGGGGGGDVDAGNPASALPCDVAQLLSAHCTSCHGEPLSGGAPNRLLTYSDLAASSELEPGRNVAQRAFVRMNATLAPMPPAPRPAVTAVELSTFESWLNNGQLAGECSPDAGTGVVDAGPSPVVCTSNLKWAFGTSGSSFMNPGLACRSCHLGQNFQGQNPQRVAVTFRAYFFMGTVFGNFHEQNTCDARAVPSGTVVEILDASGAIQYRLAVNSVGNFYSQSVDSLLTLPYTARVKTNGLVRTMKTAQVNGDCNTCHTEQGSEGAPGRIVWPF